MEKVPFETVQTAIDYVCNITEEQELEKVSEGLFEAQPDLAGFFMEFIEDMGDEAQDLGFMMALILWQAFEKQYPGLRALGEDEVVSEFESREAEMEKYLQLNDEMLAQIQAEELEKQGQSDVLNYIVEELFMDPELEPALQAEEQIHLFMICKFFAECLNKAAKEKSRH